MFRSKHEKDHDHTDSFAQWFQRYFSIHQVGLVYFQWIRLRQTLRIVFFCFIWWFSVKNSSLFAEDVRLAAPVWVGNPRWRDEPDDHGNSEVMD